MGRRPDFDPGDTPVIPHTHVEETVLGKRTLRAQEIAQAPPSGPELVLPRGPGAQGNDIVPVIEAKSGTVEHQAGHDPWSVGDTVMGTGLGQPEEDLTTHLKPLAPVPPPGDSEDTEV